MSQLPPQPPQPPLDNAIGYDVPPPRNSGMAITSLVLGIVSVPLLCLFGVGILTGITGLILGIIALVSISKNPQRLGGRGLAIAGIIVSACSFLLIVPLLIAILLPFLGKARELANRGTCAANLRGIAQSMAVYAADNEDKFPIISPHGGYALAAGGSGTPQSDADATVKSIYKSPAPSVPQNLWILVLNGQVSPKQFLCKSDPAATTAAFLVKGSDYQTNFNNGTGPSDFSYSYSFAYPWTEKGDVGGWWSTPGADSSTPLIADMAPLAGTGSPAATPDTPGRAANSFTHQRDGQNVAYGDCHVEFQRLPAAGNDNDNIYTFDMGTPVPTGHNFGGGAVPSIGTGGTPGNWDICLVPAADAGAGYARK